MTHKELEEAVPLYAIGALDRPERQALEAHLLSGCATCHAALKDYQGVAALIPFGLSPAVPPSTLKAKVTASKTSGAVVSSDEKQAARSSLEPGDWMNHLFPPISPVRSWTFQLALGFASVLLLAGIGFRLPVATATATSAASHPDCVGGGDQAWTSPTGSASRGL